MRRTVLAMTAALAGTMLTAPLVASSVVAARPGAKPAACHQVELVWLPGSAGGTNGLSAVRYALRYEVGRGETGVSKVGRVGPALTAPLLKQVRKQRLSSRYFTGWQADARAAVAALTRLSRTCPDSLLAVGGFSRGAVSTRAAVRALTRTPAVRRRVGLVVTVGDPLLRRRDRTVGDIGTPEAGAAGTALHLMAWAKPAAISWCDDDPMCTTQGEVGHDYRGRLPIHDELDAFPFDSDDAASALVDSPYTYRVQDLRIAGAKGLPSGLTVRDDAITGTPTATGSRRVRLTVRSAKIAPAVRATRLLTLDVVEPRAAAGTTLISRGYDGKPANDDTRTVMVSGDGSTVVFESEATNLVPGVSGADVPRVYAWNRAAGRTDLVAAPATEDHRRVSIRGVSRDGNRILTELTDWTGSGTAVVLHDRIAGTSTTVASGAERRTAMLTDDGEQVLFGTAPGIARWTRATGTTEPVVMPPQAGARWTGGASADGRQLLFGFPTGVWDTVTQTFTPLGGSVPFGGWESIERAEVSLDAGLAMVRGIGPASGGGVGGDPAGAVLDLPSAHARGSTYGNIAAAITPDGQWYAQMGGSQGGRELALAHAPDGAIFFPYQRDTTGEVMWASISDDGSGLGYVHTAADLLPGTTRGVTNVYFWGR